METTTARGVGEGEWFEVLVSVVREFDEAGEKASGEAIAEVVALRLGGDVHLGRALMKGMDAMAEYAAGDLADERDALDEEAEAIAASRRAFLPLLEARLQQRIARIDAETKGKATCPECGRTAESAGRRARSWTSCFGRLTLWRRWSVCSDHKGGRALAQELLLLGDSDLTPRLDEAATLLGTTVTHGMATQLAGYLLGVSISPHAMQDAVERRGQKVTALQDEDAMVHRPWEDNGLERSVERPGDAVDEAPDVAYIETDGVFPITREVDEELSQPQPGARGGKGLKYTVGGKEVKNAVLYTADNCVEAGDESRGSVLEKTYVSHLGHWLHFATLVWATMRRLRFDEAGLLVILSDGATWIRELAKWFPCNCLLILDLYHAKHRVWEVANAVFGERTPQARLWAQTQCVHIEQGRTWEAIANLKETTPTSKEKRKLVEELVTYFTNNKDRMDYPTYREQGLRISSGGVESANYHVTGARLKLQGMRWSESGAAEMSRLRADLFNGVWSTRTREVMRA